MVDIVQTFLSSHVGQVGMNSSIMISGIRGFMI